MKNLTAHVFIYLIIMMINPLSYAQQCDYFMPLKENSGMRYENYNQRDRLEGSNEVTIIKVETTSDEVIATMNAKNFDRRDRLQHEGEYTVICTGNEMIIDMEAMMNHEMIEGFKDMDLRFESEHLVLPASLSAGQSLPDASMTMNAVNNGMTVAEVKMNIINRKVEGKEQVTVPAGTFECYKISYETHMETRTMGIPFRVRSTTIEYYAPQVGMVRTEMFDEKGRPQGYTILSKLF